MFETHPTPHRPLNDTQLTGTFPARQPMPAGASYRPRAGQSEGGAVVQMSSTGVCGVGNGPRTGRVADTYGVAIKPEVVETTQRLPHRTTESMRPTPGTVSPRITFRTPLGPWRTIASPRTSRTTQPSMVIGRVSGTAGAPVRVRSAPVGANCLPASPV